MFEYVFTSVLNWFNYFVGRHYVVLSYVIFLGPMSSRAAWTAFLGSGLPLQVLKNALAAFLLVIVLSRSKKPRWWVSYLKRSPLFYLTVSLQKRLRNSQRSVIVC